VACYAGRRYPTGTTSAASELPRVGLTVRRARPKITESMAHPLIITLVHGTWGRNSPFTRPKSALRQYVRQQIQCEIGFLRFQWSGRNSNTARVEAGKELASFLRSAIYKYPEHVHVVIAHSHGVNVALHAFADNGVASQIAGVVSVGAPFLRTLDLGVGATTTAEILAFFFKRPLWLIVIFAMLAFVVALAALPANREAPSFPSVLLLAVASSCALVGFLRWLRSAVDRAARTIRSLQGIGKPRKICCLFVTSDEPGLWLGVLSGVRSFLRVPSFVFSCFYSLVELILGFIAPLLLIGVWASRNVHTMPAVESLALWVIGIWFAIVAAVIMSTVVANLLDLLIAATPLGFGIEEWKRGWFIQQSISLRPPHDYPATVQPFALKAIARELGWRRALTTLRHSLLFTSPSALRVVAKFISDLG